MGECAYVCTAVQYKAVRVFKSYSQPCCLPLSDLLSAAMTKIDLDSCSLDPRSYCDFLYK